MTATPTVCNQAAVVAGHMYPCRLPAGHVWQHRARVDRDRDLPDGRLERGAEIVWPNESRPA